jgi:hypothetical protein
MVGGTLPAGRCQRKPARPFAAYGAGYRALDGARTGPALRRRVMARGGARPVLP